MLSPRDRLYFLHIPKTAGTTLKPILDAQFDEAEICPAELWRDLIKLPWDAIPEYRFFRGHFGGAGLVTLLPEPPVTITFLRRTIPFVLSTYRFIRREPNTRFHALAASMSFSDFVADPRPRRNLSNVQVRNLSFTLAQDPRPELAKVEQKTPWDIATRLEQLAAWLPPEEKLERATSRLRAMPFFGLTDRFDESMALLAYTFGWAPAGRVQPLMVAPAGSARPEVPEDIAEQIRAFNTLDARLLEQAEPLFEARVAAMLGELAALARRGERPPARFADDPALVATLLDRHYERAQARRPRPRAVRVTVDFARRLDGSGWQGREGTGFDASLFRWTGPHTESTIDLPLVAGTDHRIELRTLNALAPDILDSLRLVVGGRPVELELVEGRGGVTRTYRGLIPQQAIDPGRPFTRLTLLVNRTLSKSSLDPQDPDSRQVGIAFHWIRVEATGKPAVEPAAEPSAAVPAIERSRLPYDPGLVGRWRSMPAAERAARNVENLRRCRVPWDELVAAPVPADDRTRFPLLFSHVKKTGGTTLQQVIARNFHAGALVALNAPVLYAHPDALFRLSDPAEPARQARFFVVMGHHKYGDVLYSLLQPRLVHFTLLRDPVARVVSHYRAVWSKPTHPLHELARRRGLAGFVEANPALECQDAQTHRLAGTQERRQLAAVDGRRALEAAQRHLLETTSLFGVSEEFDAFLLMAGHLLGWSDLLSVRQNVTPPDEALAIRDEELELVRQRNALDVELHAFATRVFRERAQALGIDAAQVAAHGRAQAAFAGLLARGSVLPAGPGPASASVAPSPTPPIAGGVPGERAAARALLPYDTALVERWMSLPAAERVARNVANLRRCVVPWDELAAAPIPPEDRTRFPLVFSHVKKTGGTTLRQVIARNHKVSALVAVNAPALYDHPDALFKLADPVDRSRQAAFFAVMGHHRYGDVLYSLLQPRFVHLTLLRDPVARVLSHFRFVATKTNHPLHAVARGQGLAAFLQSNPALEARDAQTHRLAGTQERRRLAGDADGAAALETAKRHLLETVTLFGVVEEFDAFLLMCRRLLGWTDILAERQNVTPADDSLVVREEDVQLARRLNPLDVELHAFATRVFRERLAALGITAAQVAAQRQAQARFAATIAAAGGGAAVPRAVAAAAPARRDVATARADAPLFITGRFRSGSTLLWQIFDRSERHVAFYEPCHDNLLQQIGYGRTSPSHRGVTAYWTAYLPLLETVRALHRPEFGFDRLLLEAGDEHAPLRDYLAALIAAAGGRRPVLQFNRCDFRLPWLRAQFPDAVLVHVVRDARESWASTVRHLAPERVDEPDHLDMFDLMQWSVALGEAFPFLLDARSSYERHYLLWRLSALMGARQADVSIDFDAELQADPERGIETLARVARLDGDERSAARALVEPVPTGTWRRHHPAEYFAEIEARCESTLAELGLTGRFGLEPLAAIRAAHAPPWAALDALARERVRPALAASSALRGECTRLLHALRTSSETDTPTTGAEHVG